MVTFHPLEKYELVDDVRMHNKYVPANAPVSTTLNVTLFEEEKMELTLVTALIGVPVHELDDITNADESLETSTNPTPLITIDWAVTLNTGMTLGVNEVSDTILTTPASKYGDTILQRTHK